MDGTSIDYSGYFENIEKSLSDLKDTISDNKTDYISEITELRSELRDLKEESFFVNENMGTFVSYANNADIANMLFLIVIFLGLIFGTLVFRHFRK